MYFFFQISEFYLVMNEISSNCTLNYHIDKNLISIWLVLQFMHGNNKTCKNLLNQSADELHHGSEHVLCLGNKFDHTELLYTKFGRFDWISNLVIWQKFQKWSVLTKTQSYLHQKEDGNGKKCDFLLIQMKPPGMCTGVRGQWNNNSFLAQCKTRNLQTTPKETDNLLHLENFRWKKPNKHQILAPDTGIHHHRPFSSQAQKLFFLYIPHHTSS